MSRPRNEVPRFSAHQREQLQACKALRLAAEALQGKASEGSYDDADHGHYLKILKDAPQVLQVTNQLLAERAGLGTAFFRTAVSDQRRPKLKNMLSALTAVIKIAAEREGLQERIVRDRFFYPGATELQDQSLQSVAIMAWGLAHIAREEIAGLDAERPNEPLAVAKNQRLRELLVVFAEGFAKIHAVLNALDVQGPASSPSALSTRVRSAAVKVGKKIDAWFDKHGGSVIGSTAQIGLFVAGVSLAKLGGAQMTIATTAIAAIAGGPTVADVLRGRKRK